MAKKRKASGHSNGAPKDRTEKQYSSKLGPINTFEDVADSEDEFHMNRDKILLEDEPSVKRQRKWQEEDELLEPSDEEVLNYSLSDGGDALDDDDVEDEDEISSQSDSKGVSRQVKSQRDSDVSEDEARGGWGSSKRDYYNADAIETEADAMEEEEEARRIQQKRLQELTDADFGFDEDQWQKEGKAENQEDEEEAERSVVQEVLPQLEITPAMTESERLRLLQTRYPEFEPLSQEYTNLQPLYQQIALEAERDTTALSLYSSSPGPVSAATLKYQSLSTYLGCLSMYFAILTSPAQSSNGTAPALSTSELRDHPIMDSLVRSRKTWNKVKDLQVPVTIFANPSPPLSSPMSETPDHGNEDSAIQTRPSIKAPKNKRARELIALQAKQAAERASKLKANRASLDALTASLASRRSLSPDTTQKIRPMNASNEFIDDSSLPAHLLAAKAAKKKSLRFYTSQITQKSSRRKEAGAQAGGDADLPYKERFRDRVARLNAEAEKRGKSHTRDQHADLDGFDNDDDDGDISNHARALAADSRQQGGAGKEEEDYYEQITFLAASKRHARASAAENTRLESKAAYIPPESTDPAAADDGTKRAITYAIEKNKGLTPKRKKDVRNPRVKKRNKYEAKMKKLSSIRQVYRGGEGRGGYQGEGTGIKTNVVKSVKL